jgi:hypothetical protein
MLMVDPGTVGNGHIGNLVKAEMNATAQKANAAYNVLGPLPELQKKPLFSLRPIGQTMSPDEGIDAK